MLRPHSLMVIELTDPIFTLIVTPVKNSRIRCIDDMSSLKIGIERFCVYPSLASRMITI